MRSDPTVLASIRTEMRPISMKHSAIQGSASEMMSLCMPRRSANQIVMAVTAVPTMSRTPSRYLVATVSPIATMSSL